VSVVDKRSANWGIRIRVCLALVKDKIKLITHVLNSLSNRYKSKLLLTKTRKISKQFKNKPYYLKQATNRVLTLSYILSQATTR